MSEQTFRDKYLEALGVTLSPDSAPPRQELSQSEKEKVERLLKRAVETRNFEIEMYWKRANYFWVFQAVAFTMVGLILNGETPFSYLVVPSAIGALTAWLGYLAAIGSKFWQESWEKHVDMLENELGQRLTQTIIFNGELSCSVSQLNARFMLIMFAVWLGCLGASVISLLPQTVPAPPPCLSSGILAVITLAAICFLSQCKSNLVGRVYGEGDSDWQNFSSQDKESKDKKWKIFWRDPPGGRVK